MVALANAEDREENAALALALDVAFEFILIGDANIKVAIGRQNDAVDGALVKAGFRQAVGILDALRARC